MGAAYHVHTRKTSAHNTLIRVTYEAEHVTLKPWSDPAHSKQSYRDARLELFVLVRFKLSKFGLACHANGGAIPRRRVQCLHGIPRTSGKGGLPACAGGSARALRALHPAHGGQGQKGYFAAATEPLKAAYSAAGSAALNVSRTSATVISAVVRSMRIRLQPRKSSFAAFSP